MLKPTTIEDLVYGALDIVRRRIRTKRADLFEKGVVPQGLQLGDQAAYLEMAFQEAIDKAEASALDHLDKLTRS